MEEKLVPPVRPNTKSLRSNSVAKPTPPPPYDERKIGTIVQNNFLLRRGVENRSYYYLPCIREDVCKAHVAVH